MSSTSRAMIYGANGYSGRLIAREAVKLGLRPVLAGRNQEAVSKLAAELGCESTSFAIESAAQVAERLQGYDALLNCAGPFAHTARQVMDACLEVGVDYLDITGEIEVIVWAAERDARAKEAGVALLPAVGFDVVPSDCLAAMLAARLPSAKVLQLAFEATGGMSPGTSKTMIEAMPRGGRVRVDGEIRQVPVAYKTMQVPFRDGPKVAVTIPWGDVASAWYSTGIPNIEVYTTQSPKQIARLRRMRFLLPLLTLGPLQALAKWRIGKSVKGPTEQQRERSRSSLWGRVGDDSGQTVSATLQTLGGYTLTALTAASALDKTLKGDVPRGFSTASQAFGREFILSFPQTDIRWE